MTRSSWVLTSLISQWGVIALAVIGAAITITASALHSADKLSEHAAKKLGGAGYVATGISIGIFLYLGLTQ